MKTVHSRSDLASLIASTGNRSTSFARGGEIVTADSEFDRHVSMSLDQIEANTSSTPSATPRTRKVSVRLSETILQRLEAATGRLGAGKSTVVEAALERYL